MNDEDNAFADFNMAIKLDSKNAEAWSNQALIYERRGDKAKASRAYRKPSISTRRTSRPRTACRAHQAPPPADLPFVWTGDIANRCARTSRIVLLLRQGVRDAIRGQKRDEEKLEFVRLASAKGANVRSCAGASVSAGPVATSCFRAIGSRAKSGWPSSFGVRGEPGPQCGGGGGGGVSVRAAHPAGAGARSPRARARG